MTLCSPSNEKLLSILTQNLRGTFGQPIATNFHSTVYRVDSQLFGREVAVKVINKKAIPESLADKFLSRELEVTAKVWHPHVARCLSILYLSPSEVVIVSEFYDKGTLLEMIMMEKTIREYPKAISIFRQIIEAVKYLHDRNIAHRDIKLENILFNCNGDVKLTDFGFSRTIQRRERSNSFCGTRPYTSPQMMCMKPYDAFASDYYACGIVLYTMVVGRWPAQPINSAKLFLDEKIPSVPCRKLITMLLDEIENDRAGYDECINSEWMGQHPAWVFANHSFVYEFFQ